MEIEMETRPRWEIIARAHIESWELYDPCKVAGLCKETDGALALHGTLSSDKEDGESLDEDNELT